MGALTLGPLVLSLDRAYAALGFLVLLLGSEILARSLRKRDPHTHMRLPTAATWMAAAVFLGARVGFVLTHASDYAREPRSALFIWQGGFSPWWGVAAGALAAALLIARERTLARSLVPLAGVALVAWWLPSTLLSPASGDSSVTLPTRTLATLDGGAVALADTGRVTIVNVWATWCPPCRRELPVLFAAGANNPSVRVLLINQREPASTIAAFLASEGLPTGGVLLDPDGAVGSHLQVAGLPTTLAFDQQGRFVEVHVGEISAPALGAMIARASAR